MSAAQLLNDLAYIAYCIAYDKGWHEIQRPLPEALMLMVSELAEALEALRAGNPVSEKIPPHPLFAEELADCIIRILDTAWALDLDIGSAVLAKMEYNRSRPHRHGGELF